MPVTTPPELTVAMPASELIQTPPEAVSDNVMLEPAQTLSRPAIAPASGSAFTVTICCTEAEPQLNVAIVYDIVAVPAVRPVTPPKASTVAVPAAELLQVPPVAVSDNVTAAPAQTLSRPEIVPATGSALTVTV